MDYYLLKRDNRIQSPIRLSTLPGFVESRMGAQLDEGNLGAASFHMESEQALDYEDFIFLDMTLITRYKGYAHQLVVSNAVQPVFEKFCPDMLFKPFSLINGNEKRKDLYWLCKIETDNPHVFRINEDSEAPFAVSLEVVEGLLRLSAVGMEMTKLEGGTPQ